MTGFFYGFNRTSYRQFPLNKGKHSGCIKLKVTVTISMFLLFSE